MKAWSIILAIALLVSACGGPTGLVVDEPQKVCAIMTLTGEWALYGQEFVRGMELALQEMEEKTGQRYNLLVQDDAYNKKQAVEAAHVLLLQGCDALFVPFIETAMPIMPLTEPETPTIVLLDATDDVYDYEALFSIGYSVEGAAHKLVDFALEQNLQRIVLVRSQIEYSVVATNAFADNLERRGGDAVEIIDVVGGDDYRAVASRIASLQPDAVYSMVLEDQVSFIRRVLEQSPGMRILTGNGFSDDAREALGVDAEGICKTDLPVVDESLQIFTDYETTYGEASVIPSFVLLGYDALNVFVDAKSSDEFLMDALLGMRRTSITGDSIDLRDGGNAARLESIYCVEDGELVLMEE